MPKRHRPRHGSLQVWPRKRAKSENPRIRSWPHVDTSQLSGFIGYKVGMVQISYLDKNPNTRLKGKEIVTPATILECPPLKPLSLRFYRKTPYGLKLISEVKAKNLDKHLAKRITIPKKPSEQKVPEQLEYAQTLLEKDIPIQEIFKPLQFIDAHAVTKGKGLQGTIKRYGVDLKQKKSEKHKRAIGNLGPFQPRKVRFSVAHPGQMGYHQRTDYSKPIAKIGTAKDKINPKQGFKRYGLIK